MSEFEENKAADEQNDDPVTAEPAEAETVEPAEAAAAAEESAEDKTAEPAEEDAEKPKSGFRVPLFITIIAVLAACVLTAQITFLSVREKYHRKLAEIEQSRFADSKLTQVDQLYRKYYINGINEKDLTDGLVRGFIYGAGDKYGSYMSAEEYAEYMTSLKSKTDGIGVSVIWNTEYSAIEVLSVYENSPAEKAGIEPGDLIVEADGKSVAELGYDNAINAIRGEAGTKVSITVRRGEGYYEQKTVEAVRATVTSKTVAFKQIGTAAVLSVSGFHENTLTDLKASVAEAREAGCDRIIFDMRNNPGGLLSSVHEVLDYILPEGDVVRMVDAAGNWTSLKSDASCLEMPMVVIVNGNTASAAELFTAALRDFNYATVIGTQTYGKGTVVGPYTLSDGSVLQMSIQHYYPPKSDNFEGRGITPDIVIDLSDEAKKINFHKLSYENDDQLRKAVEIIKEK